MKHFFLLALTASLLATVSQADTLAIPLGQQAATQQMSLPQRGISTQQVQQLHGEPVIRHAAVGQPPITRWDYAGFSVYFEYNHVIHSVRQHTPHSD